MMLLGEQGRVAFALRQAQDELRLSGLGMKFVVVFCSTPNPAQAEPVEAHALTGRHAL